MAMWGTPDSERKTVGGGGGFAHVSVDRVCVFAFACLSVCLFDISVTYRAAVSL